MLSARGTVALTPYSNPLFSKPAAPSTRVTSSELQNDLIAFLSVVQKYKLRCLPTAWQPALGFLGEGGSGMISQATAGPNFGLAFKRFHGFGISDGFFTPLISEVLILCQPPIEKHPNIVDLMGWCWEIKGPAQSFEAVPVLVFEKAAWDLQQFMNTSEGINLSIDDRLSICRDIGNAILTMHAYSVIHGDIKPQNVLVFKDDTGMTVFKVADFGYSTLAVGEEGKVVLPISRPWNAPEQLSVQMEFTILEAKKADVYSFGMVCFWVLFGNRLSEIPGEPKDGVTEIVSFDSPPILAPPTLIERQKNDDKMMGIVAKLMDSMIAEHKIGLEQFFNLVIARNPYKRTSDFRKLVNLLGKEGTGPPRFCNTEWKKMEDHSIAADFRVAENMAEFMEVDYRVRRQIQQSLEKSHAENRHPAFASNIALQVAFCYQVGFGVASDNSKRDEWLKKAKKQPCDLEAEKHAVREVCLDDWIGHIIQHRGIVQKINIIDGYHSGVLEKARNVYDNEVNDMEREFGEVHFIPLTLRKILGDLLDELGELRVSKAQRIHLKDQTEMTYGAGHRYHIESLHQVVKSHMALGEWEEALTVQKKIIKHLKNVPESSSDRWVLENQRRTASIFQVLGRWKDAEELEITILKKMTRFGSNHLETFYSMHNLAITYHGQGRWKEAEDFQVKAMEGFLSVLGPDHRHTLNSISALAWTHKTKGHWKEAKKLMVRVIETSSAVFGPEHETTLAGMHNLAIVYRDLGREREAVDMGMCIVKIRRKILGDKHPDTLMSTAELASTFSRLGQWKKAEEMHEEVLESRAKVLGQLHPDTLTSMANLASLYRDLERLGDAEILEVKVIEARRKVSGEEHPDTLTSMLCLASTYKSQQHFPKASDLETKIIKTSCTLFGPEHPLTLTSIACHASTLAKDGQLEEAEKLFVKVVEARERMLGLEHPDTLTCTSNLASIYADQGRLEKAKELETKLAKAYSSVLGPDHPTTLASTANLATTLARQDQLKDAEVLYVQVRDISVQALGQEHPDTLLSIDNLAWNYQSQKRWREAGVLHQQSMAIRKRTLGPEHPLTLSSMEDLAAACASDGQLEEAVELYVQVEAIRRRILGPEHSKTLASMQDLASVYIDQGRWKDAEVQVKHLLETRCKYLGSEHISSLSTLYNLAHIYRRQKRFDEAMETIGNVVNLCSRGLGKDHPLAHKSTEDLKKWRDTLA